MAVKGNFHQMKIKQTNKQNKQNTDHDSQYLAMYSNISLFMTSPEDINNPKSTTKVRIQGDNNPPGIPTQIQFNL